MGCLLLSMTILDNWVIDNHPSHTFPVLLFQESSHFFTMMFFHHCLVSNTYTPQLNLVLSLDHLNFMSCFCVQRFLFLNMLRNCLNKTLPFCYYTALVLYDSHIEPTCHVSQVTEAQVVVLCCKDTTLLGWTYRKIFWLKYLFQHFTKL